MKHKMTPGPWEIGQNGQQLDVYAKVVPDGENPRTIAVALNLSQADAEAVAYLPDIINDGRAVIDALMRLFKHPAICEYPEAASLLMSSELRNLRRVLEKVKM